MRAREIALRFGEVKTEGDSTFVVHCPGPNHKNGDRHASLALTDTNDRVLVVCRSGRCDPPAVLATKGLSMADLFHESPLNGNGSHSRIVAEYSYQDETSAHLFDVVRFDPKNFKQRAASGAWSMKGIRRVPYRLPQLIEGVKASRAVFVVEGEKDVEALADHGLVATTIPGGAGKWRKEYAEHFAGARVVIIPDNDLAGRDHGTDVARHLFNVAKETRVLELPGLAARGDVSDWLAQGGTVEALKLLVRATPALAEPPASLDRANSPMSVDGANGTNDPAVKRLALVCAADVRMEPVTYLWQDRIPLGKVTDIEGKMGVGKTTLLTAIAGAVTTGGDLPGQTSTPRGAAIIISLEDDKGDTLVPRLAAIGADMDRCHLFDGYTFGGATEGGIFNLVEDVERLGWAIKDTGAVFVGIDPFTATLPATVNSYKDQDVRRVLAPLAQLAEDTHTAIVFSRHFRKSGGAPEDAGGGSGGIGNACRSVLRVDCDPENPERYLLSSVKSSTSKKPPTIGYRIEGVTFPGTIPIATSKIVWDGESTWTAAGLAAHAMNSEDRPRADEAQDWLRDALDSGARPAKELFRAADADGIPRRTLQRAADVLGVLKERRGFGEGSSWSLPSPIRAKETPFVPSISMAPMGANGANDRRPSPIIVHP